MQDGRVRDVSESGQPSCLASPLPIAPKPRTDLPTAPKLTPLSSPAEHILHVGEQKLKATRLALLPIK